MSFNEFLNTLTLDQAQEWYLEGEQFMFIADTYDQVLTKEGCVIEARVKAIENKFIELLGIFR